MPNDSKKFKIYLQKILDHAMSDLANASSYQNFFHLYANLYVRPHLEEVIGGAEADYDSLTEKLSPKQLVIFDSMLEDKFTAVFGSRKTGKTYLMALAVILLGSHTKLNVHILSSKKETASYLMTMMSWIAEEHKLNLFERISAEKCKFWNGTTVKAHSNTMADTGTYEADILIIDEAQEVDENVWGKIMPQLMTGRSMYIWIMGTAKAGTMFHTFWFRKNRFVKFELHMSDATWVKPEAWQEIMDIMPERMVRQELLLKWVEAEGAYFSAERIDEAFGDYEISALKNYDTIICPIDWGYGHAMTMFVLGIKDGVIYELDSWGMQNAPRERVMKQINDYRNKYGCLFILEGGQMAAKWVAYELAERKIDFEYSLFGKIKYLFWEAMDFVLDQHRVKLDNHRLKQQLLRYCGDKKEDDYADSLLHGVFYYVQNYLQPYLDDWKEAYTD